MDAREYLGIIEKNECIIANKQIEKEYWLGIATGTTSKMGGERVQSSGSKNPMACQVVEAVTIDEEIAMLKAEIAEVIATLQKLSVSDYNFLHKVYVQHLSLKEVQEMMKKSYSWATSKHNEAIRNLQKILDGKKERD